MGSTATASLGHLCFGEFEAERVQVLHDARPLNSNGKFPKSDLNQENLDDGKITGSHFVHTVRPKTRRYE